MDERTRRRNALIVVLALCWFAAGLWLRYYQLGSQVLIEDEWHAVHKVLQSDMLGIATAFGRSDYSIPLTLYDHFLLLHGGLTEWTMRMPMFVSGIALLAVAPLLVSRTVDAATRALWVGLLAVSPLLVFFSKTARPYSITVLAALVAVVAARRWWRDAGFGWAAVYVVAAWVGGYLHPITLGFTLLPFGYFGIAAIRAAVAGDHGPLWRVVIVGGVLALALAATLGPPLYYDWDALSSKAGQHAVTIDSVYRTWLMFAGSGSVLVGLIVAALALIGAEALWRRDSGVVIYFGGLIAVYALIVVATGAASITHPVVQARYLLCALPFLLLAAAAGALALVRHLPARMSIVAEPVLVVFLPLILLLAGPLPDDFYYPNQFLGHARFVYDYDPTKNPYVTMAPKERYPVFYDQMRNLPPASVTLVELPWNLESQFNPLPFYQELHRQRVKVGMVTGVCGDRSFGEYPEATSGLHMRNMVHLSALLRGKRLGVDYVVVHKKPWTIAPGVPPTAWPDMAQCLPAIAAALGAPIFVDDQISVFAAKAN